MNSHVLVIYESIYQGNTKKIADAFGEELCCKVVTASVAESMNLLEYPIVVLGSGIYFTSHHPRIMELARKLQSNQQVIIFSTRGCPYVGKYHDALKAVLTERHVRVIGEFSCRGYDCTGPYNLVHGGNKGKPNERDLWRAKKYIKKILPKECEIPQIPAGKHVWIDESQCKNCKLCYTQCPMDVFALEDNQVTVKKEENCIHCSVCVSKCPHRCIQIEHSAKELIQIARTHAKRKSLY